MKNKKSLIVKIIIIFICEIIIISSLIISIKYSSKKIDNPIIDSEKTVEVIDPEVEKQIEVYNENKAINPDYVGQIYFESKLIDLPFVHRTYN